MNRLCRSVLIRWALGLVWAIGGASVGPVAWAQNAFTGTRLVLPVVTVGAERYAAELTLLDAGQLLFQLDPASVAPIAAGGPTQAGDAVLEGALLRVPLLHFGNERYSAELDLTDPVQFVFRVRPASLKHLGTRTPAPFTRGSAIVSSTFFHWFAANGGQLSGPWPPVEGRVNWEGTPTWWKSQIKQVMMANIDVLYVHLIPMTEERRITLFMGLNQMLAEGYDIPKIAPFLDPLITWHEQPKVDLGTAAGRNAVAEQYIRFYEQYLEHVTHPRAQASLATIDGRPLLTTWHFMVNMTNIGQMTRDHLHAPLRSRLAARAPMFQQPPYLVTTALNMPVLSFSDERVAIFEINAYYHETSFNGITSVQVKPGYWDQNVRNPGDFLPRAGGIHYTQAWDRVHAGVKRVYVESWNEYDEGTGIYAGATTAPYLKPGSGNVNTDVWSSRQDPFEYIRTTARDAARFNDTPALHALVLSHDLPARMGRGTSVQATVVLRNQGDDAWSGAGGFRLQQRADDPVQFSPGALVDDAADEIGLYGGIFRGRPVTMRVTLTAPQAPGTYLTRWQMVHNGQPFGEVVTLPIRVE